METIDSILQPITGYLLSIIRNTEHGCYELEIGLPAAWVFKENEEIECIVTSESENGRIIKISPKYIDVTVDNLVDFVKIIISTNKKIADKEEEFKKKIEEIKSLVEVEVNKHKVDLDELKEISFKKLGQSSSVNASEVETTKMKKAKLPKAKLPIRPVE